MSCQDLNMMTTITTSLLSVVSTTLTADSTRQLLINILQKRLRCNHKINLKTRNCIN